MPARVGQTACFTPGAQLTAGWTTMQIGTTTCDGVLIPAGAQALVGNATTVGLGADGAFKRFTSTTTDVVIDISGFFAP